MKITESEYEKIAPYLPKQRGNVKIENITMINALLYVLENGCKWAQCAGGTRFARREQRPVGIAVGVWEVAFNIRAFKSLG